MIKIQKTSKTINKVLSVFFWVSIAVLAYTVFKTIMLFAGTGAPGAELETVLIMGNYKLTLVDGYDWRNNPSTLAMYISIILTGAFVCYEIKVLKEIFTPMEKGLPFDGSVSKAIKKVAWIELAYGIFNIVVDAVMNTVIYRSLDIPSLFSARKVSDCSLSIKSDGNFLIWFVLLLLLSHVFRYGEQLQQLSDETL